MTEVVVRKATHGMKEADTSQISVLNDLLCPLRKKRAKELGMTEEELRYAAWLARAIENTRAPDKVALGEVPWCRLQTTSRLNTLQVASSIIQTPTNTTVLLRSTRKPLNGWGVTTYFTVGCAQKENTGS